MLVSGVQQSHSDLYIYVYIFTSYSDLFPYRLLQDIAYSSPCCTVGPLFVYFMDRTVYMMVLKYKWKNTPHVIIEMYTETILFFIKCAKVQEFDNTLD